MTLIAVAGGKAAGGITTTATALAELWPQPAILADCDPYGGDLAVRLRRADGALLARDMGIVGLAAAARMNPAGLDIDSQLQVAVGGLPVVVGVESVTQAARIGGDWAAIARCMAEFGVMDVVADCGRILPGLASEHVLRGADFVLLVTRATPESVVHLRHALQAVRSLDDVVERAVHVVVLTEPAYMHEHLEEVRVAVASEAPNSVVVGGIALDVEAARGLAGTPTRGLDRSPLVSTARTVAAECYRLIHEQRTAVSQPMPSIPDAVEVG